MLISHQTYLNYNKAFPFWAEVGQVCQTRAFFISSEILWGKLLVETQKEHLALCSGKTTAWGHAS